MHINKKWKKRLSGKIEKTHNRKIEEFVENIEKLGIEELDDKNVVLIEKFPKNRYGKEIGDLIVITNKDKIVIFIIELTFGNWRKIRHDARKIMKSFHFYKFPQNQKRFLAEKEIERNEKEIMIMGFVVSFYAKWNYEVPENIKIFSINGV